MWREGEYGYLASLFHVNAVSLYQQRGYQKSGRSYLELVRPGFEVRFYKTHHNGHVQESTETTAFQARAALQRYCS